VGNQPDILIWKFFHILNVSIKKMNYEFYKTPDSNLENEETKKYKNKPIFVLLIFMLLSKFFVVYLFIFHVVPGIEGKELVVVPFQTIHQASYFAISSICIIGLILRKKIFFFLLLLAFFVNLAIYLVVGTLVYQSIYDPVLLLLFIFLVAYTKPNLWHEKII